MISSFSTQYLGNPTVVFYSKLQLLKTNTKWKSWASSSYIRDKLRSLQILQANILNQLQLNPLNRELNDSLNWVNESLIAFNGAWGMWIIQRAKARWLLDGEDNLGFMYAMNRVRNNTIFINEVNTDDGQLFSKAEIANSIIWHFKLLFKSPVAPLPEPNAIPPDNNFSDHLIASLLPHH